MASKKEQMMMMLQQQMMQQQMVKQQMLEDMIEMNQANQVVGAIDNILEEIETMKQKGARVIVEPTIGFEDRLIAFILLNLKNTNCNLIELVNKK